MASYTPVTNVLDFAVSFKPSSAFPIDSRTMFGSLTAAQEAAATAVNAGSTESIYYYGMTLTVFENDVATMYTIQGDKSLKEVGRATYGDDKTIVLSADTGALSLKDFGVQYYAYHDADTIIDSGDYTYPDSMPADPADGAYVQIGDIWYQYTDSAWAEADGTPSSVPYYTLTSGWKEGLEPRVIGSTGNYSLAWYEPSTTTLEGLSSTISTLQTTVNNLGTRVTTAEGNITSIDGRLDTAEADLTTLKGGAEVEGSILNSIANAINGIMNNPDATMNSIQELVDWCNDHAADALELSNNVSANATAIQAINTLLGTKLPGSTSAGTVIEYITEVAAKFDTLGSAAYAETTDFATAAQGAKADTAVQSVTSGDTNGYINVDGTQVKVFEETAPDGVTIHKNGTGALEVLAVPSNKVTGLTEAVTSVVEQEITDLNLGDTYVLKSDVVASADLNKEAPSDVKVASEKALVDSLTWKTTM